MDLVERKVMKKGYHHTEIVGLTKDMKQPISIFSKIHSSTQKEFISNNRITYEGLDKVVSLLEERNLKGIFVNDRGYDSNEIFNYYFSKKQEYNFENFRVRTLKAINNINKMLTYTIGLIALLSEKIKKREFVNRIIKESKSLKDTVFLWFYQLARGIYNILSMARTGIRKWENIRKIKTYDGQLSLL